MEDSCDPYRLAMLFLTCLLLITGLSALRREFSVTYIIVKLITCQNRLYGCRFRAYLVIVRFARKFHMYGCLFSRPLRRIFDVSCDRLLGCKFIVEGSHG